MILRGLNIIGEEGPRDIAFSESGITAISANLTAQRSETALAFENAIAFPGLINSHDHLEFNCYPLLGHGPYDDYVAWGDDIHQRDTKVIDNIENIPRALRIQWGIVKNLTCGVTTVAHHGNSHDVPIDAAIAIIDRGRWIHSVQLDPAWRLRLIGFPNKEPYVIHIGEGTSPKARREIDEFIKWNIFRRDVIGIHGIAMTADQALHFAAVVWCPASNHFLYNTTADIPQLKQHTKVLFGTDSTLSAEGTIWDHLRMARINGALTDRELFDAITSTPADVWGLKNTGRLQVGAEADIVVARKHDGTTWDAFYAIEPKDILLVVRGGKIVLFDESLQSALKNTENYHAFEIGGAMKFCVMDVEGLRGEIGKHSVGHRDEG